MIKRLVCEFACGLAMGAGVLLAGTVLLTLIAWFV